MNKKSIIAVKKIVLALSASALLLGSTVSLANESADSKRGGYSKMEHQHKSPRHKLKMMAKVLDLTQEQQTQIRALFTENKQLAKTNRASMKQFKEQVKLLIEAEVFDEAAFMQLHQENQTQFISEALMRAKTKHAVFNILTAEQQTKWQEVSQLMRK